MEIVTTEEKAIWLLVQKLSTGISVQPEPVSCVFQLHALRALKQGDGKHPKAPLGNNFRPPQPLHLRPVRTNIDFNVKQVISSSLSCCLTFFDWYVSGSSEMSVNNKIGPFMR
jgi:hypothetical protein